MLELILLPVFIPFLTAYLIIGLGYIVFEKFKHKKEMNEEVNNPKINYLKQRTANFILSAVIILSASIINTENYLTGFPDGSITDFEKHMLPYRKLAVYLFIANSIIFFILGLLYRKLKFRRQLFIANLMIILAVITGLFILYFYFLHIMKLDNGIGG